MFYSQYKKKTYFNNILLTPWPFLLGISLFGLATLFLLYLNKYSFVLFGMNILPKILIFFALAFLSSIYLWSSEIILESISGKYGKKLKVAIIFGFVLFLLSEIMLFGAFFWTYFDRIFHLSFVTGFLSIPSSIELVKWYKEPLFATLLLLASGYTCNTSFYLYQANKITYIVKAYIFSFITNALGMLFLYIQYFEYTHLNFSFSDTVFCNIFYLLTGFHGVHVIIGNLLLFIQYIIKYKFFDNKVFGLFFSVTYWHLVDVIWIFLFLFLYFFNNLDYISIKA